ncbi:hypothetical protein CL631_01945 [bacterium]|nr:hypothetical protein [bacterium]|tara:strand:- start:8464 stop:11985 length:3522 start_codon:yes stop_codon:yes gene_type:complete
MSITLTTKRVAAVVIAVAMIFSVSFALTATKAHAVTLSELVELFIALGVIGPDKAEQARSVLASQESGSTGGNGFTFTKSFSQGDSDSEVKEIQKFLNTDSDTQVAASGVGSAGNETNFFGGLTKAAVIKFQEKYASEVLAPVGLSAGTGYWGSSSRAKANALNTGSSSSGSTDSGSTDSGSTDSGSTSTGTGLSVASVSQPANTLAPDSAARVPFTKVALTASSDGDIVVNNITVERTGLAPDAVFANVALMDEDGNLIGLTKTLNSNHQAKVGTDFTVKAGTTKVVTVVANMAADNSTRDGTVAKLEVVSVNTSATVSGSLPLVGASHTINASLAIGAATLNRGVDDPNASDTLEIGETGYTFQAIRVTAGSAEDIRLRNVRWNQTGSAGSEDLDNVVVVVDGTEYATEVSSDGKFYTANFGSGIVIAKGLNKQFSIKGDLVGGPNRTAIFDIDKNIDIYITGETFGYGITGAAGSTATAAAGSSQFTTGTPFYDGSTVTISAGSVSTISKATTVAAQNIAISVANQPLGGFDIEIKGEAISVGQMVFNALATGNTVEDITNVSLVDQNGNVIAGPVDGSGTGADGTFTFTDTVTLPIGKTTLTLKGQLNTDFVNDDTIVASTTPSSDWTTVTGDVTGNTITPPSTTATGNTMTVKAATTTVTVAADPATQNVVAGTTGFTFANYQFDATDSGEDVRVSTIQFRYTDGGSDPTNCLAWDGTTKLTNSAVNPSGTGADTYTFNQALVIPKGTIKTVALKCDVPASSTADEDIIFGINNADTMAAVGLGSGQTITLTHGTTNSGTMTIKSTGTFTVLLDSSSPSYKHASAGTTGNVASVLKLRSTNEDITLNRLGLQLTGATASSTAADITKVTLWDGTTKVGEGLFTGTNTVATTTLTSGFTLTKDVDTLLTVKIDLAAIGTSKPGTAGSLHKIDYDGDRVFATEGNGADSGTSVQSSSTSDTAASGLRTNKSYPTLAKLALPTNTLANGDRSLLRFSVTADSAGPVGLYKFTLVFSTTTATMTSPNVFAYTDQLFSVPVSGLSSDGAVDSDAPTNWATSSTQIEFLANTSTGASTTIQVPAGATRYFEVRGTVSGSASGASISTQLEGDTGYPSLSTLMTPAQTVDNDGNDDFLWSPNSTTTAAYNDDDWTNGFGLIGLPSSNMTAEIVSQ